MEYIDWIQQETFRLGTPVAGILLRKSTQDHILGNVPIAKGTTLGTSAFPSQVNPLYFKDPEVFRP